MTASQFSKINLPEIFNQRAKLATFSTSEDSLYETILKKGFLNSGKWWKIQLIGKFESDTLPKSGLIRDLISSMNTFTLMISPTGFDPIPYLTENYYTVSTDNIQDSDILEEEEETYGTRTLYLKYKQFSDRDSFPKSKKARKA